MHLPVSTFNHLERLFGGRRKGASRARISWWISAATPGGGPPAFLTPAADGSYVGYLAPCPASFSPTPMSDTDPFARNPAPCLPRVEGRDASNAGLRATLKDEAVNFLAYNNGG